MFREIHLRILLYNCDKIFPSYICRSASLNSFMIIVKPKGSTLTSLTLFIILIGALVIATFTSINRSDSIYWYHYLFLVILIPLGVGVLIKVIFSYKIISIGKEKISWRIPALFKNESYTLKDLKNWQEITIKTTTGVFQQLEIKFDNDHQLTLSRQEHTNYDDVLMYLKQKAPKRRLS